MNKKEYNKKRYQERRDELLRRSNQRYALNWNNATVGRLVKRDDKIYQIREITEKGDDFVVDLRYVVRGLKKDS